MQAQTTPEDDFNDSLDDLIGGPAAGEPRQAKAPPAHYQAPAERFQENCVKCGGTGRRFGGACFGCAGTGKKAFKTSYADRAKAKTGRTARKARTAAENMEAFSAECPDVWAWMNGSTFPFAVSLRAGVEKYGSLTAPQLEAARRCIAKVTVARTEAAARVENAPAVSMDLLTAAFASAGKRKKLPALIVEGLVISQAKSTSANPGALYVKTRPGDLYLGKIIGGKFMRTRECTAEQEAQVLAVAADPKGKAIAFGRLTTTCACCGKTLTDPESIKQGIGPVCATNFGW